jgi:ppGpp synthetase/RelA/SpoT-type nucleotidyltranferase
MKKSTSAEPNTNSSVNRAGMEKEHQALVPVAESFCKELSGQIIRLLDDHAIALGFPIQSRVKTWDSLSEKFDRVNLQVESVRDVQDLIGLRLILLFGRDVSSVCRLLEENFKVVRQYNTRERLKDDQFGYSSMHFVIELPENWLAVPTLARMRGLRAEIQVRTVAQHIWAEASQALQYKQKESVPASVTRAIHRVSALLETIDLELERVLEQRESYRADVDVSGTQDFLNVDLLEKTLGSLLPAENKSGSEDFAALLQDYSHFGIATQKDLRDLITKHLDSILAEDKSHVADQRARLASDMDLVGTERDRILAGVFFTHAGLARAALNQEFPDLWDDYQMSMVNGDSFEFDDEFVEGD